MTAEISILRAIFQRKDFAAERAVFPSVDESGPYGILADIMPFLRVRLALRKRWSKLVHGRIRENLPTLIRARGNEVSWPAQEYELETVKSRPGVFGGHRPPLQVFP
jgi:hypothetical protein